MLTVIYLEQLILTSEPDYQWTCRTELWIVLICKMFKSYNFQIYQNKKDLEFKWAMHRWWIPIDSWKKFVSTLGKYWSVRNRSNVHKVVFIENQITTPHVIPWEKYLDRQAFCVPPRIYLFEEALNLRSSLNTNDESLTVHLPFSNYIKTAARWKTCFLKNALLFFQAVKAQKHRYVLVSWSWVFSA